MQDERAWKDLPVDHRFFHRFLDRFPQLRHFLLNNIISSCVFKAEENVIITYPAPMSVTVDDSLNHKNSRHFPYDNPMILL